VKGPPVRVVCDCGERALVAYPATWECEKCGRRWNTAQIPADDYWGILADMRRFRFEVIRSALVMGAIILVLAVLISATFFILVPVVFGGWYAYYMPRWRKRVRASAQALPQWTLYPE
jgi:hypothetical protein